MAEEPHRPAHTGDQFKDILELASEQTTQLAQARAAGVPPPASRRLRARGSLIGLVVSVPILAILVVANVWDISLVDLFTPAPTPEIARQLTQDTLDGVVEGIESFRQDYAALPTSLVEVGVPSRGTWTYSKTPGGHYQVVGEMYGQSVTYDSAQRKPADARYP